jgi:Ca2+-binding RTX toxin-like protein
VTVGIAAVVVAQGASWSAAAAVPTCFGLPATIVGTDGRDLLDGTAGPDVIVGGEGRDTIRGLGGDDKICAGPNRLSLTQYGAPRYEEVSGGDGNDQIRGGTGYDLVFGDAGDDVISLGNSPSVNGWSEEGPFIYSELAFGGLGDDRLDGDNGPDRLGGGDGNDVLRSGPGPTAPEYDMNGEAGDDILIADADGQIMAGGPGDDVLRGGAGDDQLFEDFDIPPTETLGTDVMDGGPGNDSIASNGGPDTLRGGPGDDRISGGQEPEHLVGGTGDDILTGGDGDDIVDGGPGTDIVAVPLFAAIRHVVVDLAAGTATGFGSDTLVSIEGAGGQAGGTDVLLGDTGPNVFIDLGPGDHLDGRGGSDWADFQATRTGNHSHGIRVDLRADFAKKKRGRSHIQLISIENVRGSDGPDTLIGDQHSNRLDGWIGADKLRGLKGRDTLIGSSSHAPGFPDEGADRLFGGAGSDQLFGGTGPDRLFGGKGRDHLRGGKDHDQLHGGHGLDANNGGSGTDTCLSPSRPPRAVSCENS